MLWSIGIHSSSGGWDQMVDALLILVGCGGKKIAFLRPDWK